MNVEITDRPGPGQPAAGTPVYIGGALIVVVIGATHRSGDWRPTLWTALGTPGIGSLAARRMLARLITVRMIMMARIMMARI